MISLKPSAKISWYRSRNAPIDGVAVVGGLDKIIPNWTVESENGELDKDFIEDIAQRLSIYPLQDTISRKELIDEILLLLNKYSNDNQVSFNLPEEEHKESKIPDNSVQYQSKQISSELINNNVSSVTENREDRSSTNNDSSYDLDAPITYLTGIGKKNANYFHKLEIYTIKDLLYYYPFRYEDYSKLVPINRLKFNDECSIAGIVENITSKRIRGNKQSLVEAKLSDGSGYLRVNWFNKPFLINQIQKGDQIIISGKVGMYLGRLVINNPEWEPIEKNHLHTNRILPVYPLTAELTQRNVRRTIYQAVDLWSKKIEDYLPQDIRNDADLIDLRTAIHDVHFPDNQDQVYKAQQRLAFDEIFLLQLNVLRHKHQLQSAQCEKLNIQDDLLETIIGTIPYKLTDAQNRVLAEIIDDFKSGKPMNRLLQGDVGSGKTVIAAIISYLIIINGGQVAIMAPTSILAEQHYHTLTSYINNFVEKTGSIDHLSLELITGDTSEQRKFEILQGLADGNVNIIIGTHALIEDPINFNNLKLSVIDEQHRFGVSQRAKLRHKGKDQHLLVMTATPIPRSLALTIYGDLDVSLIDQMPPGRTPVETHILSPFERERAYQLIKSQVESGFQAFIVYPYVESGDREDIKAATEERDRLAADIFPKKEIGLLHGRMKADEKDQVMKDLKDGHFSILTTTSVVEVGIDIPKATVILIEGANRFGLAQLHQFRGRVGRGSNKSYCLLIPEKEDQIENERLLAMEQTNDGFQLAEKDLAYRGPGDFLGFRQSGFSNLKMATLSDIKLIEKARKFAQRLFNADPGFFRSEHISLKQVLEENLQSKKGDIS